MVMRILIFLIASAAAGGAAWLTTQTGADTPPRVEVHTAEIPTRDVLVASGDIPAGEVLAPDKLRWEAWPEPNLNAQFITRSARPDAMQELSGTFVNNGFAAGEPIRDERLMAANANLMSNKIEPGMRAASVKISAESAAGGFILPGDRVDVIHTVTVPGPEGQPPRNESRIIISNVRVLAIDQVAVQTPEGTAVGKTATLELTPADTARIMGAEASGLLSLALRATTDHVAAEIIQQETTPKAAPTVVVRRRGESSIITLR